MYAYAGCSSVNPLKQWVNTLTYLEFSLNNTRLFNFEKTLTAHQIKLLTQLVREINAAL